MGAMMSERIRIYVAGASAEIPRVLQVVEAIERIPQLEISSRWWLTHPGHGRDQFLSADQQESAMVELHYAIASSDIVWALWPARLHSEGVPGDFAYALACRDLSRVQGSSVRKVFVSGKRASHSAQTVRADYRDTSDALAFHAVLQTVDEMMRGAA